MPQKHEIYGYFCNQLFESFRGKIYIKKYSTGHEERIESETASDYCVLHNHLSIS